MVVLLYLIFFLSGAAALVYEVVWARWLSLVFGGSHLAVTTVLAVFMGGLALGSWIIGRRVDRIVRPLRLYALLEIGIGAFALVFALLVRWYPILYVPLARLGETSLLWLSFVRVVFALVGMIVPTTLMGGTLPVVARFMADRRERFGAHLALLYGFNTLGAVTGSFAAGFLLLERFGADRTLGIAVATNVAIGIAVLVLFRGALAGASSAPAPPRAKVPSGPSDVPELPFRLVLWGIGISGFCALGYEVLWTRVLSMVVGTSVYSFTIMLVAFLTGIALGGSAAGPLARLLERASWGWRGRVLAFAASQAAIGIAALATTYSLRLVPMHAASLQRLLAPQGGEFAARQGTSFLLAFGFMALPAFFMGLAFPLAGIVRADRPRGVGVAVGEVLAFNTVGAILGAAGSGFVLIYLVGVERSLQALALVNVALALAVAASLVRPPLRRTILAGAVAAPSMALLAVLAAPERVRMWDPKFFAVYRNNQRAAFDTMERIRDALQNTDVLYYHEGINETISVIRPKRAAQAFIVNGRSEATTLPEDVQCQRTLGHLPMLVHPNPRSVFVLGLGTGMTLGATSIHPEAERITLAEIESGVFGAARTFSEHNHSVLSSPKLRVVHDDGRNFLRGTRETFDVITADPIHPWSGGAAYLYTTEYFQTAAERLTPGGVICQWLPLYELTTEDVRGIVRTFVENFRYTALWVTYYDAELLGSNAPLVLDEAALARRFANPEVARDLAEVGMGTPRDFLSYMIAGDAGARDFARGGFVNTDDNLRLEFSSPRAQGVFALAGRNIEALAAHRENPLTYLSGEVDPGQRAFWIRTHEAGRAYDRAHALALWNRFLDPEFERLVAGLRRDVPEHAPTRFLVRQHRSALAATPRPIDAVRFQVAEEGGRMGILEVTAVTMRVGQDRGVVVFVDNAARETYGQRYFDHPDSDLDARLGSFARGVLSELEAEYRKSGPLPERAALVARLKSRAAALTAASDAPPTVP